MKLEIINLIDLYQRLLDDTESKYDPSDKGSWRRVQYLNEIINRLHDVKMYQDRLEGLI